jgi:hypothetical protein
VNWDVNWLSVFLLFCFTALGPAPLLPLHLLCSAGSVAAEDCPPCGIAAGGSALEAGIRRYGYAHPRGSLPCYRLFARMTMECFPSEEEVDSSFLAASCAPSAHVTEMHNGLSTNGMAATRQRIVLAVLRWRRNWQGRLGKDRKSACRIAAREAPRTRRAVFRQICAGMDASRVRAVHL